jgi:serine/threonine protein kinase
LIADRYDILKTLGQGAFGRTLLGRDTVSGHAVAIKVLDGRGADWKAYELFEREAAVLRGLRHQGIPQVYEAVKAEYEGTQASILVMEYVEGTSLAERIASKRPLENAEVIHILLELLGILEYLHGRVPPILHRDIKPANIILRSSGFPALVDFGSVRHVHLGPDESGSTVAGTYGYMPYEQYMGQASPASDLYALGATMLHLLTGRPPREFMNDEGRIQVPTSLPGDPRLQPIIARLLRPSPPERFTGAHEVRAALLSPGALLPVPSPTPLPSRRVVALVSLPRAPRAIEGDVAAALARVTPSGFDLMDASNKPNDSVSAMDVVAFIFYSVITAGILPLVFFGMASQRRRRLRTFFEQGTSAEAVILGMQLETIAFAEKMMRVNYEFQVEGLIRRDSDQIMPVIANRWTVGDRIQVLYIAERDFDSVIIST